MGEEGFKPVENTEQEQNLNGEQDQDQPGTAENHLEDAALSLFQQAQSGFLDSLIIVGSFSVGAK